MPLRRQPQQQRSRQRVEQILDAAADVFDEVGFEAATTHTIASRANTAVGSLYQFFPDKFAIFHALELRHIQRVHAMWEKMNHLEVIQLPFEAFIRTLRIELQELFSQPTSRIVFIQFFSSPNIFQNIDESFTQEAINVLAKLLQKRNPALTLDKSWLFAEVCVHAINTLLLLALRRQQSQRQQIFEQIEALMMAYLRAHIGDKVLLKSTNTQCSLNKRQKLALAFALKQGGLTIQDYEALCPQVSRRTLQRDLQAMVQQKLFLPEGKTNQLYYHLLKEIKNL